MISKLKKALRLVRYGRPVFGEMGEGNRLESGSITSAVSVMGSNNYVGNNVIISNAEIGSYCSIAPNCLIGPAEHDTDFLTTSNFIAKHFGLRLFLEKAVIGNDVWLAANVVVRQGVRIGDGAVVGANSFVNKDIPDYAIAVGSPAKVIGYRFDEAMIATLKSSGWWGFEPDKARDILRKMLSERNIGAEDGRGDED